MAGSTSSALDVHTLHEQFPVLAQEVRPGLQLIYLDSASAALADEIHKPAST